MPDMPDMPDKPDVPEALSIREAATRTGRSEAAIYHLIATDQLPARPTASRGLAIDPKDLGDLERGRRWWPWGRQRGQQERGKLRRLRAGVRRLLTSAPPSLPGLPWYWPPPLFAWLASCG